MSELERQQVIERLQDIIPECREWALWNDYKKQIEALCDAIGCSEGQDWQDQTWVERLIDLIERPTCGNKSEFGSHTVTVPDSASDECFDFVCSRCGIHLMGDELDCGAEVQDGNELLPCPFCGSEPELIEAGENPHDEGKNWIAQGWYIATISCPCCACQLITQAGEDCTPDMANESVIRRWNTRESKRLK